MSIAPDPNNNAPAVQTFALTRVYGPMVALNALNLTVNRGDLFGFIGSNRAGKTTTRPILATLLSSSPGTAHGVGHAVRRPAPAGCHRLRYIPAFFCGYNDIDGGAQTHVFGA